MRISDWSSDVCSSDLRITNNISTTMSIHNPLEQPVRDSLERYFADLGDAEPRDVLAMVVHCVECSVLQVVLEKTQGNQRSEEHTSELQSLMRISYAVFCLKKKKQQEKYADRY